MATHYCGYCGLAFGSMAKIKEHIKENPEHNDDLRWKPVLAVRPNYHPLREDNDDAGGDGSDPPYGRVR